MENDILDSLNDLGYEGPLSDETAFTKALDSGAKSLEFTKLVHILAEEIKRLCNLEETVNTIDNVDESSSFLLELSSFLKELKCPYKTLVTGHMTSRLQSKEDRLLLLDYLISELMAARMVNVDCPKEKQAAGMEIVMQESPVAKALKEILISLKFNKPPPNITPEMLFARLEAKLKDTIQKEGDQLVGKPLYNKALTDKDWKQLESSFTEMFEEYRLRRETLITRLECTIQSFEWSDRLKTKKDVIQSTYRPKRENLKVKPDIKLSDFLAARTSLLLVEKTSSATVRKNTQTDVNKVIIGQVPDRGGRPNEQQPPPPEMPSWQQRSAGGGGGRGGGRGGGGGGGFNNSNNANSSFNNSGGGQGGQERGRGGRGGRGGRVQGGYSQGGGDHGRGGDHSRGGDHGSRGGDNGLINSRTETIKLTRFHPVVTTTMVKRPSATDTDKTRAITNMDRVMVGTEVATREVMTVWAALIKEDTKEAAAVAETAVAAAAATRSPTQTTKVTSRVKATSPNREVTSPRAGTSPEGGATRMNTTTGTDVAGAGTEEDVDILNNSLYVTCKVRSTPGSAHLLCVTEN